MLATATNDQIQKYKAARLAGMSQAAAASEVGLSKAWGNKMDGLLNLRPLLETKKSYHPEAQIRPLRVEELSPIAKDCLEDFGRFRAREFGRISSPWQENAANVVLEHLYTPYKEFGVINVAPGTGKSTLFTHDIPAWLTTRSRTLRGFIGSGTQTQADWYTGRLRNTFARRIPMEAKTEDLALGLAVDAVSTLQFDYGVFRPDPTLGAPWSMRNFTVAQFGEISTDEKEATWTAFGKDTGFLGFRVNFIVWDDLFRRQDMLGINRAEKLQKFYYWYDDEAETRLEPGGLLILQGQRLGAEDIYHYCKTKRTYTDEDDLELFELGEEQQPTERKYFTVIYKAHYEEHCKAATDPKVHLRTAPAYDPKNPDNSGCLIDPVRLPWREQKTIMFRPLSNYRIVYQQEDVDPVDALVPAVFIDGGTLDQTDYDGCWDDDRAPGQLPSFIINNWDRKGNNGLYTPPKNVRCLSIITADPSPTKFWAVQWWLYIQGPKDQRLMGKRYLLDQVFTPMGANDLLDYNVEDEDWTGLLVEWESRATNVGMPIQHFILEVNAAQKFMKQYSWFKDWMRNHNIKLKSHHTHINKLDDKLGVTTIRSHYEFGRVRLPGDRAGREVAEPLYLQVTRYPEAVYDDCVMAHWFLEYQLQHLVKKHLMGRSIHHDMPSWLNKEPSYA